MTDRSFLIKIIPPEGYDVYRLHLSRTTLVSAALALVALVVGALTVHAWQLHAAENDVRSLRATAAVQRAQLVEIDRQADALAGQLRDLQRENADIRRLLGAGARGASSAPPGAVRSSGNHADAGETGTVGELRARLQGLAHLSAAQHDDTRRLDRLTHRVLDLRRVARIARDRMIAALPSINPVGGTITARYGWRVDPWPEFHRGVDLAADYGTPVHAAADATVVAAGWDGGFGNKVDLDHGNGYHTWYAHLSRFVVAPGAHVRKGDVIAYVGATGEATGPHLHYQVMRGGEALDPEPFLRGISPTLLATLPLPPRVQ